jgi:hypothetical protein
MKREGQINVHVCHAHLIRAIGEQHWEWASSYRLMGMIKPVLKDQWQSGQLDFSKYQRKPQIVTGVALHMVSPAAPKDASKALEEGFLSEENPYPPSSPSRDRWDRAYAKAKRGRREFA